MNDGKINYCDTDGNCTATDLKPDPSCRFYQIGHIEGHCDHNAFNGACLCKRAKEAARQGVGNET